MCEENILSSILQRITDLRKKEAFDEIYDEAKEFFNVNNVDLDEQYRSCRKTIVPSDLQECIIESTLDQRETF